jgi:hypothetical protein
MRSGDRYFGRVLSLNTNTVVLLSETLGRVELPREKVAAIKFGSSAVAEPGESLKLQVPETNAAPPKAETPSPAPPTKADVPAEGVEIETTPNRVPRVYEAGFDFQGLWANDIFLNTGSLRYKQTGPKTEWSLGVLRSSMDFEYQPVKFDFNGRKTNVFHDLYGVAGTIRRQLDDQVSFVGTAGAYEGFADYQSAWLAEYFQQQFGFFTKKGSIPGDLYQTPDPKGYNFSAGFRWEYLPAAGFVQAEVRYAYDRIAPGYEINFNGLHRGNENIYTTAAVLTGENVLTPRVRLLNDLHVISTTDRQTRLAYQGSVNVALWEHLVVRPYGGYAVEAPEFKAFWFGGTLEYEVLPGLLASISGQYYSDTGQIQNSDFTTAAPSIETRLFGFGLRYQMGRSALKVFYAPWYDTTYGPIKLQTVFFKNLYKNRDFSNLVFAYSYTF